MLANTKKYTVGRSPQCDLSLPEDISVSREHAYIYRSSSGVRVEDKKSKYGVFINDGIDTNTEIPKDTQVDLQAGNIVRFGRMGNTFRLEKIDINVCTSSMQAQDIEKLAKQLKIINGTLQSVWDTNVTHLVMTNVTVTVKVLQSLAHGIPIISPAYFDAFLKCASEKQSKLPDVNDYIPVIVEPFIIKEPKMMEVHLDRQRLFQNKTFVFMLKRHMDKFAPIITLAAGKCVNIEQDKVGKSLLKKTQYIPVQYSPSANSQCSSDIEAIVSYIQSIDRRLISETEIGLAIIHRATDRFCNPDRKLTSTFEPASVNTDEIVRNVLIEDTPNPTNPTIPNPPARNSIIVPESVDLSGTEQREPNNNLRNDEAIDSDKPSTSSTSVSTRRSTRSSAKNVADDWISVVNEVLDAPKKAPTPKKNTKRKHTHEKEDQPDAAPEESEQQPENSLKKQKTHDDSKSQGESSSAHFIAPLPPQSPSAHNFSGFISTQSRKRKATQEQQQQTSTPTPTPESSKMTRKRALRMLTADSDEEQDDNNGKAFNFSRKSKRSKVTSKTTQQTRTQNRNDASDNDDDDDDDGGFNFTQRKSRKTQAKQKCTQQSANEIDIVDAAAVEEYLRPFQQSVNRSFNRTMTPIEIIPTPKVDADWISLKMKKELNLDESHSIPSQPSSSVRIKEEKLEEWELTDEEKKRQWIKSMANVFEVRKVELNTTRRSVVDETDSAASNFGTSSLNSTKNFKKFVKVYLFKDFILLLNKLQ